MRSVCRRLSLAFDDGGASSRGTNSEARNFSVAMKTVVGSGMGQVREDCHVSRDRRGRLVRSNYAQVSRSIMEAVRLRAIASGSKAVGSGGSREQG